MEETKSKKQPKKLIILLIVAIAVIAGICIWYFQYKKPHDQAVADFNTVVTSVLEKNTELEAVIKEAQSIMDAGEPAYDSEAITNLTVAIADAQNSMIVIPEMPGKTADIISATEELSAPIDYSSAIENISNNKTALENSILQMKQITNPSEAFVIERIKDIEGISGIQAVTEEHDPNGNLNKQGGYTAAVYFSSEHINQSEVYGNDIVDKGTDCGGCIEVYASAEDAEARNTYLAAFDNAGALNSGSHEVLGTILIRTSRNLTATQQNDLTEKISNRLLELE